MVYAAANSLVEATPGKGAEEGELSEMSYELVEG